MKLVIILALVAFAAARPDGDYSRYENFEVDETISNLRLLKSFVYCFLDRGKCTPEAADFKKWVPEVLETDCAKCSEHQKSLIAQVLEAISQKLPEEWEELKKKHNPDGKFDDTVREFLAKYGKNKQLIHSVMKLIIMSALLALAAARPGDDYSKYDNFDIDEVTNNDRLTKAYAHCFIGEGKCTPEGLDFKKWIPDALQNKCAKCSDKQKVLVARIIKALIERLPEEWKKLNKLHNPDGKYDETITEFVKQYGN
ncbi:uncharacterized protein LOC112056011 [Bicyclus anynana]|uniref:Uncharacterized protein LOC112056011 n=1 Tax=Bicyclus anynana TaxID=110368 RepID=A0ABM3LXU5_BICAN|nr:uncharacterized protein LOC112056011 [Bicyclus anynana]